MKPTTTSHRVIASILKPESLEAALNSSVKRINLVAGSINELKSIVDRIHEAGKEVYVHLEMVQGIGRDASFIQYLADSFAPDGIITTKSTAVQAARQAGLRSIQRIFAIDTAALETALKMIKSCKPDEVELMPGLMPRIIAEMKQRMTQPIIVGGLLRYQTEMEEAWKAGADYVSISDEKLWK